VLQQLRSCIDGSLQGDRQQDGNHPPTASTQGWMISFGCNTALKRQAFAGSIADVSRRDVIARTDIKEKGAFLPHLLISFVEVVVSCAKTMKKIFLLKGKERKDQEIVIRELFKKGRGFSWNKQLFTIWKQCAE
jgi:hypothetical protein